MTDPRNQHDRQSTGSQPLTGPQPTTQSTTRVSQRDHALLHGIGTTTHTTTAYNLTIADIHTYYVLAGNTPVLVHNAGPGCSPRFEVNPDGVITDLGSPPVFRQDTSHIFRNSPGHLANDTPTNRATIQGAVSPANLRSRTTLPDGSTIERYFQTLANGIQAWAVVRGGQITNGGLNITPR